jgi:hypothetical protein
MFLFSKLNFMGLIPSEMTIREVSMKLTELFLFSPKCIRGAPVKQGRGLGTCP